MIVLKASSSISSLSWISIARLVLPSRVSLFDERADTGERLAPPVVQFLDPRIDQPGRRFALGRCALGRCALFHIICTSFGCFSILRRYQSPIIRANRAWL